MILRNWHCKIWRN